MKRLREPLKLSLILLCLLWVLISCVPASRDVPDKPNVLFIMVDDLNGWLEPYGHPYAKTPELQALADKSVVFSQATADSPICNPSRTSMLTGLRPTSTGILTNAEEQRQWRDFLANETSAAYEHYGPGIQTITTIFQHFKGHGYYTAVAGKVFHNVEQQTYEQSLGAFDKAYMSPGPPVVGTTRLSGIDALNPYKNPEAHPVWDWGAIEAVINPRTGLAYTEDDLRDTKITEASLSFLNTLPRNQPFFLAVGYSLPHMPLYSPKRFFELYEGISDRDLIPPTILNDLEDIAGTSAPDTTWNRLAQEHVFSSEQTWAEVVRAYLAAVSFIDFQVGLLLQTLEEKGLSENTIIVFWSDHGVHMGTKDVLTKNTLWHESVHVPFMVHAPALTPKQVTKPINSVDIFPTLTDLTGIPRPTDFPRDGRSLVPLLKNNAATWPWPSMTFKSPSEDTIHYTLWDEAWTYIDRAFAREVYERSSDPYEWSNIIATPSHPLYDGAEAKLAPWQAYARGQMLPNVPPATLEKTLSVSGGATDFTLELEDENNDPLVIRFTRIPEGLKLYEVLPDGGLRVLVVNSTAVQQSLSTPARFRAIFNRGSFDETLPISVSDGAYDVLSTLRFISD